MVLLRCIHTLFFFQTKNNVRIRLNKTINWVVFDYILLIFYNSTEHSGDVSPESNMVLVITITVDLIGKFIIFIFFFVVLCFWNILMLSWNHNFLKFIIFFAHSSQKWWIGVSLYMCMKARENETLSSDSQLLVIKSYYSR